MFETYCSLCLCSGGIGWGKFLLYFVHEQAILLSTLPIGPEPRQRPSLSIWFIILLPFFASSMRKQLEGNKFVPLCFFIIIFNVALPPESVKVMLLTVYICFVVVLLYVDVLKWKLLSIVDVDSAVWMPRLVKCLLDHCGRFVEDLLGLFGFCNFDVSYWILSWIVIGLYFFWLLCLTLYVVRFLLHY